MYTSYVGKHVYDLTGNVNVAGRENRDLDVLVFKEVLDNMAHVDRVLTMPGGSILMAGRSGVGRRTAITLVTFMHQMSLFTPKMSRGYGIKQFKNDLKTVSVLKVLRIFLLNNGLQFGRLHRRLLKLALQSLHLPIHITQGLAQLLHARLRLLEVPA